MSSILSATDLTKSYGTVQAVRGVSLEVAEGTCFGLLGPNGAGKTTTIELLEGIGQPTSGSVAFRGASMNRKVRQHIGIQFQATALQDFLTVNETLRLFQGLYERHKPLEDIVEQCALGDLLNRDNRKLSGGQRQRLLLAIALINDPELLFLDEPTTGLDPQARRNFWTLLRDVLSEGKTVVLTTHYMEEAYELCDTIAIMDHGRIIAEGEPSALLEQHFGQSIISLPIGNLTRELIERLDHAIVEPTAGSRADRVELSTRDLARALAELQRLDIDLTPLEVRRMTLEDLFIALTGEALRGMIRRYLAVLHARNIEFLRDRAALSWNLVLPLVLVFGLAIIFSGGGRAIFKVGVFDADGAGVAHPFLETRHVEFVPMKNLDQALEKLRRHQIDMLIEAKAPLRGSGRYWINDEAPKGYLLERMLLGATGPKLTRASVVGKRITYVDWLTPGILGMNMMFSCLFGVGYVVVRYRKSGFLKRLNATPLSASEFVAAQITSRLILSVTITVGVYLAVATILDLRFEGNPGAVILVVVLGAAALVSMGFCVAARVSSEELASGLLNLISWPMMFLAGVWFSLEGSPAWVQYAAKLFPLTHALDAARAIMLEGATLADVWGQTAALAAMTIFWFFIGAYFFKWRE